MLNAPLPKSEIEPAPTLLFLTTVSVPSCTGSRAVTLECLLPQSGCCAIVRCTRACAVARRRLVVAGAVLENIVLIGVYATYHPKLSTRSTS